MSAFSEFFSTDHSRYEITEYFWNRGGGGGGGDLMQKIRKNKNTSLDSRGLFEHIELIELELIELIELINLLNFYIFFSFCFLIFLIFLFSYFLIYFFNEIGIFWNQICLIWA